MHGMNDIISAAESLPIRERALIVDSILKTLNKPDPDIDQQWVNVARQRLEELRSEQVETISGDEVFSEIKDRFSK